QVRHLTQVLERGLLLLDRIGVRIVNPADDLDRLRLKLHGLRLALARRHRTDRDDGKAPRQPLYLALVVGQRGRTDDLQRIETGTVVQVNEGQSGFGVSAGPDPAAHRDHGADRNLALQNRGDVDAFAGRHGRLIIRGILLDVKIGLLSLGCPKNLVDSEVMLGLAQQAGHELTNDPSAADVLVVNTCAFIDSAKQESIDTILEMAQHKKDGACRRLIVTGCLAERYRDELKREIPEIDAVLGTGQVPEIVNAIDAVRSAACDVRGTAVAAPLTF